MFQYNKQDLPEVTPMEAMEGTLNARKSDSFTAVAIRGVGVLETFSAILARTLRDMVERLELSDRLQGGPSVEDWGRKDHANGLWCRHDRGNDERRRGEG